MTRSSSSVCRVAMASGVAFESATINASAALRSACHLEPSIAGLRQLGPYATTGLAHLCRWRFANASQQLVPAFAVFIRNALRPFSVHRNRSSNIDHEVICTILFLQRLRMPVTTPPHHKTSLFHHLSEAGKFAMGFILGTIIALVIVLVVEFVRRA